MNQTWERIGPVVASIAIIIVVAVLRERSKAVAAITATMPMTVALALWLVYAGEGADQAGVIEFVRSMVIGLVGTLCWVLAVWAAARAGWGLGRLLAAGYATWAVVIGLIFLVQSLLGGPSVLPF